jgi:hypothetical protein
LANTTLSAGGVIFFPSGYTFRISSNITFPSNVTLCFAKGSKLTVDTGVTVTIQGSVDAVPETIIFTGLGTVSCTAAFPAVTSISWWDSVAGTLGFTSNYYGTYTPVASALLNLSAVVFTGLSMWSRVGNLVTVNTRVSLDPIAAGSTNTSYDQSIPVASDFTDITDVIGQANFFAAPTQNGVVVGQVVSNKPAIAFEAITTAAQEAWVTFTYLVKP